MTGFWSWLMGKESPPPPPATPDTHSSDILRRYTSWLEKQDASKIPLPSRAFVIRNMRDEIIRTARRDGQMMTDKDGQECYVKARLFRQDIAAMNKVLDSLRYSPALIDWLNDRRQALVRHLHETWPPGRLRKEWRRQTLPQRMEAVSRFLRAHCEIYQENAIPFTPSKIIPFKGASNEQGYTVPDPAFLKQRTAPPIYINQALLEARSPFTALETAHHEQIHVFLAQLAAMAAQRRLPADHPLHPDAQIKLTRIFNNAAMSSAIWQSYAKDPEEIVCHSQHKKFIDEYRHQPFWQRVRQLFVPPAP